MSETVLTSRQGVALKQLSDTIRPGGVEQASVSAVTWMSEKGTRT